MITPLSIARSISLPTVFIRRHALKHAYSAVTIALRPGMLQLRSVSQVLTFSVAFAFSMACLPASTSANGSSNMEYSSRLSCARMPATSRDEKDTTPA